MNKKLSKKKVEQKPDNIDFISSIEIANLKGLKNVKIQISDGVTCLIGANGTGKSSVLHALACAYQSYTQEGNDYNLSDFFTPYANQTWVGSSFIIHYKSSGDAVTYSKENDRWLPKKDRKKRRDTFYIGLSTCVPAIESETRKSRIKIVRRELSEDKEKEYEDIKNEINRIMGRNYREIFEYEVPDSSYSKSVKKTYLGMSESVSPQDEGKQYSSLAMSAGEQRCIQILHALHSAPAGSLILIEELDVLIHEAALKRLVEATVKISRAHKLQVVFTCHNLCISDNNNIEFRHLVRNPHGDIFCYNDICDYNLFSLTGKRSIKLTVFVEDILSKCIVSHVLRNNNLSEFVDIKIMGSYANAFPIITGLSISGQLDKHNAMIIMDGDVCRTRESKIDALKKHYTGSEIDIDKKREALLKYIFEYNFNGEHPENFIKESLVKHYNAANELVNALKESPADKDGHIHFSFAFDKLGCSSKEAGYAYAVDLFAKTNEFEKVVSKVQAEIQRLCKQH